ncbi:helix-turn-helix domain-containing protein [Streptomyces sp. NPDC054796]
MTPGTPRTRLTPAEIQEARDLHAAGLSIRAIAAELERSYGAIHGTLTRANVTMRPRGGRHPGK